MSVGTDEAASPAEVGAHDTTGGLAAEIGFLRAENDALRRELSDLRCGDYVELSDARVLQDVGIYRYHHPLETAAAYQERLESIQTRVAEVVKSGRAIVKSEMFTFNNSLAQGRRMTDDLAKLMLRAYNSEADNSLRTLRAGNVITAKRRLDASRHAIAKLGSMMEMRISDEFHGLRFEELELTADWLMKKQEEREIARDERARLREEHRVAKELAEERSRLDKEHSHLANMIAALEARGEHDPALSERLAKVNDAIAQNDFRTANIRAGYVYVISNEGAFGKDVVKIGLTRRLEPRERIYELGGASVPFRFDTHALYFSEDAVTLESELHRHFAERALNRANSRKEFFFATPAEVREVLLAKVGNILEFTEQAEAIEYRQSLGLWPER
jgi:bifunctional DNA-binding transcriptional regulator/antitoxin component of YhaV-PrlF toxin-antitoxin module